MSDLFHPNFHQGFQTTLESRSSQKISDKLCCLICADLKTEPFMLLRDRRTGLSSNADPGGILVLSHSVGSLKPQNETTTMKVKSGINIQIRNET